MKDKIIQIIADNSVEKNFCEYGKGVFATDDAVEIIVGEIEKLFSLPVVNKQSEQFKVFVTFLNEDYAVNIDEDMVVDDYMENL